MLNHLRQKLRPGLRGMSDIHDLTGSPALKKLGIITQKVYRNLSVPEYYEISMIRGPSNPQTRRTLISNTGAMCAYSASATGRTPKAKRIVKDETTEKSVWWGNVNMPLDPSGWDFNYQRAVDYFNNRPYLYVVDGYVGWDPKYRLRVRIVCTRAYHALFMNNMLIRPTVEELKTDFDNIDYTVLNAGEFYADPHVPGIDSQTSIAVNLQKKQMVILGSQYAGEMKKGLFSVCQYVYPEQGAVTLHASANEGPKGDTTLLFGLSGTGKTTLSADPTRQLLGDDEHVWTNEGIFNIEGGCYAKAINLRKEKEPEIYDAIKFGTVLENICFHPGTRDVNYDDASITENTRVSYPLDYIPNVKMPAIGGHPKNIIFLTCDAYGVLPPVAKLTSEQAMYHFMSGYTAKVAGTEIGIKEPQPTFSACFGEAFLTRHPSLYAKMLADKMKQHGGDCWLVNTGWTGGKYGVGNRMDLKLTRKLIDAIHSGETAKAPTRELPVFGLRVPESCSDFPSEVLFPKNTWSDKKDYDETLKKLGEAFRKNFEKYEDVSSPEIKRAGPQL